ncbi:MAG TPA: hypothetical protein VFS13_06570 [Steroidobacteraceae bacterium]|nr:hypothetical protein [Steroidobacteraceae bacterium]
MLILLNNRRALLVELLDHLRSFFLVAIALVLPVADEPHDQHHGSEHDAGRDLPCSIHSGLPLSEGG